MRQLLLLLLLANALPMEGQTYNDFVSDSTINSFMRKVLVKKESYGSAFNKLPKKVYYKPVHIGQANWYQGLDTAFDLKFKALYKYDSIFSPSDFQFIRQQYYTLKDTQWNFSISKIKLKKKNRPEYFEYSIPLFTKDFSHAIFWRFYYYGPLAAYSELHIYKRQNKEWVIKYIIGGWMS